MTTGKNKRCIISLATRDGNYINRLARLCESLRDNFDGDIMAFIGESAVGAPLHSENPYAFKVYAFRAAEKAGYESVLWLDTSCFAIKNVSPIFDEIEKDGFIFQTAGHKLSEWCNDFTLDYFELTRQEAEKIEMIGNAGFLGLDLTDSKARLFLQEWEDAMNAGCFKGSWSDHRHDMSCSSAILHFMGGHLIAKPFEEWLQYGGIYDETLNNTIILKAQG
jgi:hypothetical protein